MDIFSQFVSSHPIAAIVVGIIAIIIARILIRDIGQANRFIDEVNAERATISQVQDRRGQNRAKNIVRPAFGQTTIVLKEDSADLKTGTID